MSARIILHSLLWLTMATGLTKGEEMTGGWWTSVESWTVMGSYWGWLRIAWWTWRWYWLWSVCWCSCSCWSTWDLLIASGISMWEVPIKNDYWLQNLCQVLACYSMLTSRGDDQLELVRVVVCAVTETKCPLLTALFFSLLSLRWVIFLPEGVIVGFRNFAWGFNSPKK